MPDTYGFSWKWAAPAIAVVACTLLVGVLVYPGLPDRIPVHFGAGGEADSYWRKSVFSAFGVVGIQILLLPLLFAAASSRLRRLSSGPDFPTFGRTMLLFAVGVELTLSIGALMVWQLLPSGPWAVPTTLAPTMLGVVYMLVQSRRHSDQPPVR